MTKVTMEQREAIVREAIAKRDAIRAGVTPDSMLTDAQITEAIDKTADPAAVLGSWKDRLHRLAREVERETRKATIGAPLNDEEIERAWWSLGTEPDGSNLAGGTNLEGWKRAVRWTEEQHGWQ